MSPAAVTSAGARASARRMALSMLVVVGLLVTGCSQSLPPLPPWEPVPVPPADDIESVLVLIGDAGWSVYGRAPVMAEAAREVEAWSERLGRDSAVAVLFLGDIAYPAGLHPPGHRYFPRDSVHIRAQIDVVDGPAARQYSTLGYFVAGNHDWGEARGIRGVDRLRNLEAFLERGRERWGAHISLLPAAGRPGPAVVDVGRHMRLLLIDTAWWLLAGESERRFDMVEGIEEAIATAGDRWVMIAAHHPWQTAGPHGGTIDFWQAFGLRWFLHQTGTILQDINSRPMRELRYELGQVFDRVGPPLIFAGGHEHSLQVIRGTQPQDPTWVLVSGSAAKVNQVGHIDGMLHRAEHAGYMTLVTRRDGSSILYVRGAPAAWIQCPNHHQRETETCMAAAPGSFELLYSTRIEPD